MRRTRSCSCSSLSRSRSLSLALALSLSLSLALTLSRSLSLALVLHLLLLRREVVVLDEVRLLPRARLLRARLRPAVPPLTLPPALLPRILARFVSGALLTPRLARAERGGRLEWTPATQYASQRPHQEDDPQRHGVESSHASPAEKVRVRHTRCEAFFNTQSGPPRDVNIQRRFDGANAEFNIESVN